MSDTEAREQAEAKVLGDLVGVLEKLAQAADRVIYISIHGAPPSSPRRPQSGRHLYTSIYGRLDVFNTNDQYQWVGPDLQPMQRLWRIWVLIEEDDAHHWDHAWVDLDEVAGWCAQVAAQLDTGELVCVPAAAAAASSS